MINDYSDVKEPSQVSTRQDVYLALSREDAYAHGWTAGDRKSDPYVSVRTGQAFSAMEWIVFVEKYLNEAKIAYANYLTDENVVNIRLLKAASLLVSALTCSASPKDLEKIAGVSSTKFPINRRGLQDLVDKTAKDVA